MPRYARESEKRSRAGAAGVCPKTPNAVQIDGQIDLAHISNILEDAIDVLKNDNTKLAGLITLLKTVLEKAFLIKDSLYQWHNHPVYVCELHRSHSAVFVRPETGSKLFLSLLG